MQNQHGEVGLQRMHWTCMWWIRHGWAFVGYCLLQTLLCRIGNQWLAAILFCSVAGRSPMDCLLQTLLCGIGHQWVAAIWFCSVAGRWPMAGSVFALRWLCRWPMTDGSVAGRWPMARLFCAHLDDRWMAPVWALASFCSCRSALWVLGSAISPSLSPSLEALRLSKVKETMRLNVAMSISFERKSWMHEWNTTSRQTHLPVEQRSSNIFSNICRHEHKLKMETSLYWDHITSLNFRCKAI